MPKQVRTILITGTHHTPAIELINELQKDQKIDWQIHYVAHQFPSETHLKNSISKLGVTFHPLNSGKYNRHRFLPNLLSPFKIAIAFAKSISLVKNIRPDIVVSFGGYISVPVVIAASIFRIKSITHEQTLTFSLSTKINSIFVNKVALSFPSTKTSSKYIVTGNLLRHEILDNFSTKYQSINQQKPIIYITGGNQGSQFINQLIFNSLKNLTDFTIIHQTGTLDFTKASALCLDNPNYFPTDYVGSNDIGWIFHNSEIIVSRAGANTCQEINLLDKKSILIPLPHTQQNEQYLNAKWLNQLHPQSTIIFDQSEITPAIFIKNLKNLLATNYHAQPQTLPQVHPLMKLIHDTV